VQNTVCGLSSLLVFLMMGIMMPETCSVTNISKPSTYLHLVGSFFSLHDSKMHCHMKLKIKKIMYLEVKHKYGNVLTRCEITSCSTRNPLRRVTAKNNFDHSCKNMKIIFQML
jgi:hypothetical protein